MNDFDNLKGFVNKKCKLTCKSSLKQFTGWVYTVDPVSLSVVLVELDEQLTRALSAHVVMNDEVMNIEVVDEGSMQCENLFTKELFYQMNNSSGEAGEDLDEKREGLIKWLEKNRIPVKSCGDSDSDNGVINIMDTVFIHKPFVVESCESTNEIILNKIINLVKQFNSNDNNKPSNV